MQVFIWFCVCQAFCSALFAAVVNFLPKSYMMIHAVLNFVKMNRFSDENEAIFILLIASYLCI